MGLFVYTVPGGSLGVIETALRASKFHVERRIGSTRSQLLVRSGFASAFITDLTADLTEGKKLGVYFTVTSARDGLLSAVICWPLDFRFGRKITRSLEKAGARPFDF